MIVYILAVTRKNNCEILLHYIASAVYQFIALGSLRNSNIIVNYGGHMYNTERCNKVFNKFIPWTSSLHTASTSEFINDSYWYTEVS